MYEPAMLDRVEFEGRACTVEGMHASLEFKEWLLIDGSGGLWVSDSVLRQHATLLEAS